MMIGYIMIWVAGVVGSRLDCKSTQTTFDSGATHQIPMGPHQNAQGCPEVSTNSRCPLSGKSLPTAPRTRQDRERRKCWGFGRLDRSTELVEDAAKRIWVHHAPCMIQESEMPDHERIVPKHLQLIMRDILARVDAMRDSYATLVAALICNDSRKFRQARAEISNLAEDIGADLCLLGNLKG